jgi:putative transposase
MNQTPGSPWENGYCQSFNWKLHNECLDIEIFYILKEARIVSKTGDDTPWPNLAIGYRFPARIAIMPAWLVEHATIMQ